MANFYLADLHLGHENILKYDKRTFANAEEMGEQIIEKWNDKVTNGDTVYILGDMAHRCSVEYMVSAVARLKGRKILLRGNHDDLSDYRYRQLFHEICDYKELTDKVNGKAQKLVLSHYPILMWNGQHSGTMLLYGHTHITAEDEYFQQCISVMNKSDSLNMSANGGQPLVAINVGCMQPYMEYQPKTLSEILAAWKTYGK